MQTVQKNNRYFFATQMNRKLTDKMRMEMKNLNQKIEHQIELLSAHNEPYKSCKDLSLCFQDLIQSNQVDGFQKNIELVSKLYQNETHFATKNAIENVLLYRLSTDLMLCKDRKKIFQLLPLSFQKIITGQMNCSSI